VVSRPAEGRGYCIQSPGGKTATGSRHSPAPAEQDFPLIKGVPGIAQVLSLKAKIDCTSAALKQTVRFCATSVNVRIAYATMGRGVPLVRAAHFLTHVELDAAALVWSPWLAELSRDRLLVHHDGRNCGLSDRTASPLGLEAWLSNLQAAIDASKLQRFSLLGCSRGGALAIAYAARNPEGVSSLVLLGAYARGSM
jgi:alpha/beta hydrolase fold